MSARRPATALKRAAQEDVLAILLHTVERWGVEQRDTYREKLYEAFSSIRNTPGIGRPRDDISVGLRCFPIDEHIIYYRVSGAATTVVRVLHRKMDAARHLGEH